MMKKFRVYGGLVFRGGKQPRVIVAAHSWAEAARLTGLTPSHIKGHWAITGNEHEVGAAMARPGVPLYKTPSEFAPPEKTTWRSAEELAVLERDA